MKLPSKTLLCALAFACGFGGNFPLRAIPVLSYHNDSSNIGVNAAETQLTPSDITTGTFQKLYATPVDSKIFAQPLYVPGVTVTGGAHPGRHDLVIVGTQGDILYAMDAATGVIVWQTSFLLSGIPGATTITPVPSSDSQDIYNATPTIGILGTPVIDPATNLLYVLVKTKQIIDGQPGASFVNTMYKIDIALGGTSDTGAPLNIVGRNDFAVTTTTDDANYTYRTDPDPSAPQDPFNVGTGGGDGEVTFGTQNRCYFNALRCLHRSALMIANGNVYACFASAVGVRPYHGWMLGFNESTLALSSVTNLTPNALIGGIWASGAPPVVDSSGNIFVAAGNGYFDGTIGPGLDPQGFPVSGDYGDCLVKLTPDANSSPSNQNVNGWGLKVADYFTPSNNLYLYNNDLDLGCGGIVLLPDSYGSTAHPHLLVTAGKQGTIYLLDRDALGKFNSVDKSVQELLTPAILQNWSTPALFNGMLFFAAQNDNGKAFPIANGVIGTTPIKTPDTFLLRGATPSISANGATHGVVWMLTAPYEAAGQLRAYSAANFATEIWTSDQAANGRDALGTGVRFTVPTVADGRVFVGTATTLVAYGLNPTVAVITSDPPTGTAPVGAAYNFTFTAAGAPSPTFALTSGTLPPGLTLSPAGLLSGTPTTPGAYTDTVTASRSGLTSASQTFTITVSGNSPPPGTLGNPVGYWQFSEGAGATTVDSSGNGVSGTLAFSPIWVPGMFGGGLNFNGTSSCVNLNDTSATGPLKPPLPVTISAWVNCTATSGTQMIFASDSFSTAKYAGYGIRIAAGQFSCLYGDARAGNSASYYRKKTGTTLLTAGQWYHVTAVIQGPTSMSLYINGVDDGGTYAGTGQAMAYTAAASKIGTGGNEWYFNGIIDDLRIYNRALNPTEVHLLANGPVSNWRLDEGTGSTVLDSGKANVTGALVNSPSFTAGWFGDALNFNGTSSSVNLNDPSATGPLKPPLPVTVSAWINCTATTGTQMIFASDSFSAAKYAGYGLRVASGQLSCLCGDARGGDSASYYRKKTGTTLLTPGRWYYVTAVIQGPTSMSLYINGVDDGGTYAGTGQAMAYTTAPSKIGTGGSEWYFNGLIDDLRVYNRALSAPEIQSLANANSGPIPPE